MTHRPKKPKKKHFLREATGAVATAVMRDAWADPIGGQENGNVYVDTKLNKSRPR